MLAAAMITAGIAFLVKGADWLVSGGSGMAKRLGISDLVIGLTIVAFGTSAPELAVNVFASASGSADIAIGNIVGSNIANILLILGAAAVVSPLAVQRSTVLKEIPFSLLAAIVLLIAANDRVVDGHAHSELSRSDGLLFIGFFIIFLYYTFSIRKSSAGEDADETDLMPMGSVRAMLLIITGLVALVTGGKLAVSGAVRIATALGVSQALIGLTVVAVGTSLPELATSVVAAWKGKADIAVGNIVGSNIFNIFWILGISAVLRPLPFPSSANADLWTVVLSTLLLFAVMHNGHIHHRLLLWWKQEGEHCIRRWEGGVLLAAYLGYIGYIAWRG